MRHLLLLAGLLVMGLGLGCLNYTTDGKAENHARWAEEKGFPAPSNAIFVMGLLSTAGGGALAGFALGRRNAARS